MLKSKQVFFLILTFFLVILIIVCNPFKNNGNNLIEQKYSDCSGGIIGPIITDNIIEQRFICTENGLKKISLFVATYGRKNTGTVSFQLIDADNNSVIDETSCDISAINDNQWYSFEIAEQSNSKDKLYILRVLPDEIQSDDNCITIYKGIEEGNTLTLNGVEVDNSLCMMLSFSSKKVLAAKVICWIVMILVSYIAVYLTVGADEKTFLIYAIIFGVLTVLYNQFPHFVDEGTHFFRSYMISEGKLIDEIDDSGMIGGYISTNYTDVLSGKINIKTLISGDDVLRQSFVDDGETFVYNPYMSSVLPTNHIIAALGIQIADMLNLSAIVAILLGRIFDMAFYTIFCYLAIKKATYFKSLFFVVATFPVSFWLGASFSIDPILFGASLLLSSICLSYYFEKDKMVSKEDKILLIVCVIFIASVKYLIYTPILLLFFLIPRRCFSRKDYWLELGLALGIVFVMIILQAKMLKSFNFIEDRNGDVDVMRQVAYILGHKLSTIQNILSYSVNGIIDHVENVTIYPAMNGLAKILGIFTILGGPVLCDDKYRFNDKKARTIFILLCQIIFWIVFVATVLSIYCGYSPVGTFEMEGFQTRYLVPVFLFLMLPLSCINVESHIKKQNDIVAFVMLVGILNMLAGSLIYSFA